MIPPLPASTLDANPAFAKLWRHVTTNILDQDGARKSEHEARRWRVPGPGSGIGVGRAEHQDEEADEDGIGVRGKPKEKIKTLEEKLSEARVRRLKREILKSLIGEVAYQVDDRQGRNQSQHHGQSQNKSQSQAQSRIPLPSEYASTSRRPDEQDEHLSEAPSSVQSAHSTSTIGTVANSQEKLSSELRDLLLLLSAYIELAGEGTSQNRWTVEDEEDVLYEEFAKFHANLPIIASAVGARLVELESSLASLASLAAVEVHSPQQQPPPQSTSRQQPTQRPSLLETLTPQTTHLSHLRTTTLPGSLTTLTSTVYDVLKSQSQILQSSLLQLESSKHGVLSRHALSRAAFFAQVAVAMDLKTRVLVLEAEARREIESEEARVWIRRKMEELEGEEQKIDARIRELRDVLEEYEAVDPGLGVMKRLGVRYREVEREMEEIRSDIERLEKEEKR